MTKVLVPLVLALLAIAGGLYAGEAVRKGTTVAEAQAPDRALTDVQAEAADPYDAAALTPNTAKHSTKPGAAMAYYRFPSQFFVPVMHGDRLDGMMVMTLTVEMPADVEEEVFKKEFRLRDAFLRSLLVQANTGGFDGNFTIEPRMRRLRDALMETATEASGGLVTDVLIEDIARQDAA